MSLRSLARWTLPPLALLALGGWISSSNPAAPASAAAADRSTAAPEEGAVARPAAGPAQAADAAERPATAAAVAAFVARKNAGSAQDTKAFAAAGWQLVDVPAPDAQLVGFDPALLHGREDELRQQIASTTGGAEDAPNLARIASEAHDEATGIAAVEGLGRLGGEEAQTALEGLLHALPAGAVRSQVAPLLRPRSLQGAQAARLAALLDSRDLSAVERRQLAFTLSLIGLRDQSALPESARSALSDDARALLAQATALAILSR